MSYSIKTKSDTVTTVHSAITASVTSTNTVAVNCKGYNSLIVYTRLSATGTPNWTIDLESACTNRDSDFADTYDETQATGKKQSTGALTESRVQIFKGVGNFVKAVPTENSGTGTCTVLVQPINL